MGAAPLGTTFAVGTTRRICHIAVIDDPQADIGAPGGLGELARRLADSGAKVHILYMATGDRVVVGSDGLEKAAEALGI